MSEPRDYEQLYNELIEVTGRRIARAEERRMKLEAIELFGCLDWLVSRENELVSEMGRSKWVPIDQPFVEFAEEELRHIRNLKALVKQAEEE